jgi:hypothetical protein
MDHDDGSVPPDSPADLLSSYTPFIGDVPLSAYAEPFPVSPDDLMPQEEMDARRQVLRRKIHNTTFSPPLPLSDFCLVAEQRWAEEAETKGAGCTLL